MQKYETLALERVGEHVLIVTLNRPEVLNAINTRMGEETLDLWARLSADPGEVRCAVLTGAGERAFCAGGDLKERDGMTDEAWRAQHEIFERSFIALMECTVPVIAAVNGHAYGGGLETALCCDFIYAARGARFALSEVRLGIMPGGGGTQNLARAAGERRAKELATQRLQKQRELELAKSSKVTLEDFYKKMQKGVVKDLNLILKADVQGSIEALTEALKRLSTEAVQVNILHTSVGAIHESDCMLASASDAIILGFNVKIEPNAQALAEQEKIDIRLYEVIYDALNDVRKAMEGLLEPIYEEHLVGRAKVIQLFNISRVGKIAGCFVQEGKIVRGSRARVVRDGQLIHEGEFSSLKRMKDDVKEVTSGFDCGLTVGGFQDFQVEDIIESYVVEKKTAHL